MAAGDTVKEAIEINTLVTAGSTRGPSNEAWEGTRPEYGCWFVWRPGSTQNGLTVKFVVEGLVGGTDTLMGVWTGPSDRTAITASGSSAGNMVLLATYDDTGSGTIGSYTPPSSAAQASRVIDSSKTYYLQCGHFNGSLTGTLNLHTDLLGEGSDVAAVLTDSPVVTAKTFDTTTIDVSWTTPAGTAKFNLDYNVDNGPVWTSVLVNTLAKNHRVTGLETNTLYYFRVTAINADNSISKSSVATANTTPIAPTARTLSATVVSNKQINLSWSADAAAIPAPTYTVQFSVISSTGTWTTVVSGLTTTSYSHTNLSGSTTHHHRVLSVSSEGVATSNTTSSTTSASPVANPRLKDDFANLNNWNHDNATTFATATGGLLKLNPNSNQFGITAKNLTSLFGSNNTAEWVQYSDAGTQQLFGFEFNDSLLTKMTFSLFDSLLYFIYGDRLSANSSTSIAFNATSMKYWQLEESGGSLLWRTSPDFSTWTTRRSLSVSLPVDTLGQVRFYSGISTGSSVKTADFASLNLASGEIITAPGPVAHGQLVGIPL